MTIQRWFPLGDDAVLVEFRNPADRWQVRCPPALETVVGATTVLLRFDPDRHSPSAVVDAVTLVPVTDTGTREHVIDVVYDGPDLGVVADRSGLTVTEVIRRHSEQPYLCEFCGFAPGFAYLSGIDQALIGPRRDTPRPQVPAGSVAIAGPFTAIYPMASPGGWFLLGTTTSPLFQPDRHPPALITPGDRVRFRALS